jgi:hypothetical protein
MVVILDHLEQEEIQVPEELKAQPEQKDLKVLLVLLVQQELKVQLVELVLKDPLVSQVLEEILDHKAQQVVRVQ